MAPEDLDKLTLFDLEAIAARLDAALRTIREARELLGGGAAAQMATPPATVAAPPSQLLPHELAQREMLLQRNREALPDVIRRAEGIT